MTKYLSSVRNWFYHANWPWLGRHFLFWVAYFLLTPYQLSIYGLTAGYNAFIAFQMFPLSLLNTYFFIYGVLPYLLNGHRVKFWLRLVLWSVGLWSAYLYWQYVIIPINTGRPILHSIDATYPYIYSLVPILLQACTTGVAASLTLWRHWYQKEQNNQQLAQENALAELQLLKAQIHPHFLFNTLNNLYSLTLKESGNAPEIVLKLAELLHYMLDECALSDVSLQKERQAIDSYLDLEKLRYGKRLEVRMAVSGDLSGKTIPPLLLIPFVENAFKHGSSRQIGQAYIHIQLRVMADGLIFTVTNSLHEHEYPLPNRKFGGMGLKNVRKRLTLLFPHQHKLLIRAEKDRYEAELTIPFRVLNPDQQTPMFSV